MKKKYLSSFILSLVMIIPLFLSSVSCVWTFYDKPSSSISKQISIILGKFNFFIPEYPNEYPNTEDGKTNKDAFDTIAGSNITKDPNGNFDISTSNDGVSLSDPTSPINKALGYTNIDRNRPYILSDDYFDSNNDGKINRNDITAKEYFFGKNADPNLSFVIVRETFNNPFVQYYSIYTCSVNLSNLNVGDEIRYIYKTKLKWTIDTNNITKGSYTLSTEGNIEGICNVKLISSINNRGNLNKKVKTFDYISFK